jgi:hypothetical protein
MFNNKIIFKGFHNSFFNFPKITNKDSIQFTFKFDESAKYNLDVKSKQLDINKLCGRSFGFHHDNSFRIGWRWDNNLNSVQLLAYIYKDGKRLAEHEHDLHIYNININEVYTFHISFHENSTVVKLINSSLDVLTVKRFISMPHSKWGYWLWPYFGGKCAAPHKIKINLK